MVLARVRPPLARLGFVGSVGVIILHAEAGPSAGPLERWLVDARHRLAERQRRAFVAATPAGADVRIVSGIPDGRPFGAVVRELARPFAGGGVVVLGSGSIPLATAADRRALVAAAGAAAPGALTNNRYSSDVVAVACAEVLASLPDLPSDNALPRWLAETAGYEVADRRGRRRLGFDIDGPLDLILLGSRPWLPSPPAELADIAGERLARVRAVTRDPGSELLVAGRLSAADTAWVERTTASRTRALIEERGLRTRAPGQRPARSTIGLLLDRDGPAALGAVLAELADAALVDSRVLLAHRFGADERGWPRAGDRFASDLLLAERIADPWLAALTRSARDASIPVVLGGHSLVGPGLRLALGAGRGWT